MPGLCGYSLSLLRQFPSRPVLAAMQQSLIYRPHHLPGKLFTDDYIAATSVALACCAFVTGSYCGNRVTVWCDGEHYTDTSSASGPFAQLLYNAYTAETLIPFLRSVDAVFAAVIHDPRQRKLHLIGDRFGLRQLYLCTTPAGIAWASEIKAFRHLPISGLNIDPEAVNLFIGNGHFTGKQTWFKEVTLLEPASICTWDFDALQINSSRYWNRSEIPERTAIPDSNRLADELGTVFTKAVTKRCSPSRRIGIGLSGGLDSRAIFAALPPTGSAVPAVTFGRPGCPDITIARRVAALRPSRHVIHEITADNWLSNRLEGIRLTDGQFNMLHMHGIEHIDEFTRLYDIELNGFLGDALLGGSYANHPDGEFSNFLNRGRRFIAVGLYLGSLAYHTRLPFFDKDLIELTLSIPLRFRRGSALYNRMLLRTFPEYFTSIPWQKSGLPVSRNPLLSKSFILAGKVGGRICTMIPFLSDRRTFVDYASWLRTEPARSLFTNRLTSSDAPLFSFIEPKTVRTVLAQHFSGLNRSELLGRYLTVDEWLRYWNSTVV